MADKISIISKSFKTLVSSCNAIATGWIFMMMLAIAIDVVGRAIFNKPLAGSIEFVKVSLVGIVFLQIPDGFLKDKHIRSDVILARIGSFYSTIFHFFGSLLGCFIFIGVLISSWRPTIEAWKILEYEGEGALNMPTYPIRTIIILCSVLTAIIFFSQAVKDIKKLLNYK